MSCDLGSVQNSYPPTIQIPFQDGSTDIKFKRQIGNANHRLLENLHGNGRRKSNRFFFVFSIRISERYEFANQQ